MRRRNLIECSLCLSALLSLSCSRSATLVRGNEATELLKSGELLLAPGQFTYAEARDRISGKLVLAIFNRDEGRAGNFRWVRKEINVGENYLPETWNVLLLNTARGERGKAPTAEIWKEIQNSNLVPAAVTDERNDIRAVIYKPALMDLVAFLRPDGSIRLEIGRRIQGTPDIPYSLKLK